MGALVKNTSEAHPATALQVPTRPDGSYFRFEMIADGGWSRYYDDTPAGLLTFLIPGYSNLQPEERVAARLRHSVDLQVRLQARLNVFFATTPRTAEENAVLMGQRNTPPRVSEWLSSVPLVLVDMFYQPYGDLPKPDSPEPDDDTLPTLWWLRPAEGELEYLRSLHEASLIDLNVNQDEVP